MTAFYDYSIRKYKKSGECKPCIITRVNKSHRQAHSIKYFKSDKFKEKKIKINFRNTYQNIPIDMSKSANEHCN